MLPLERSTSSWNRPSASSTHAYQPSSRPSQSSSVHGLSVRLVVTLRCHIGLIKRSRAISHATWNASTTSSLSTRSALRRVAIQKLALTVVGPAMSMLIALSALLMVPAQLPESLPWHILGYSFKVACRKFRDILGSVILDYLCLGGPLH